MCKLFVCLFNAIFCNDKKKPLLVKAWTGWHRCSGTAQLRCEHTPELAPSPGCRINFAWIGMFTVLMIILSLHLVNCSSLVMQQLPVSGSSLHPEKSIPPSGLNLPSPLSPPPPPPATLPPPPPRTSPPTLPLPDPPCSLPLCPNPAPWPPCQQRFRCQ